jgi:hypothetical protein
MAMLSVEGIIVIAILLHLQRHLCLHSTQLSIVIAYHIQQLLIQHYIDCQHLYCVLSEHAECRLTEASTLPLK